MPINTQLKPTAFVKMVLEYYYYYGVWKEMCEGDYPEIWITELDTEVLKLAYFNEKDQSVPYVFISKRKR